MPPLRERDERFRLKNYEPIHRTEEFKETVRRIKNKKDERPTAEPAATETPKQPQFKVPLPGAMDSYLQSEKDTRRQQEEQKKQTRSEVRNEVIQDITKKLPPGTKLDDLGGQDFDVNAYIEYKTDLWLQAKQNPSSPGDSAAARHKSRIESQHKKEQITQIRTDVIGEYGTPAMGMSPDKYKEFIDQKVQERVQRLATPQQPRYVFLSDGRPFYFDDHDERADLERSLIGESPIRRKWTLAKYDLANGISNTLQKISDPSIRLKEVLTDTDQGNVLGGVAQLGFNSALLGVEYLRAGAYELFVTESRWKRLEQEAEAVKYTDPAQAQALINESEHWKEQWNHKKNLNARLKVAKLAVDRSWEKLFGAWDYVNEQTAASYDPNAVDPATGAPLTPLEQAIRAEREKQNDAKFQASTVRDTAMSFFGVGNYEEAIKFMKEAHEKDRAANDADPYGAYTWAREPEKYDAFTHEAAILELQKGEPLTDGEIRRLKEYHVNSWTELTGEFIFDPLNAIPAAVMDDALRLGGKGLKAAGEVPGIKQVVHVMGSPVRWLRRQTVMSGANKISAKAQNLFDRVSSAYLTVEDTTKAIEQIGETVARAKNVDETTARAIFEKARQQTPGLQNLSFSDFKQLMDAGEHLDPATWGKLYQDAAMGAEDDIRDALAAAGKNADEEVISEVAKNRRALETVSQSFHKAFTDPHRIYKGSSFTDDTISGWVIKTVREMTGQQISETLKLNRLDDALIKWGETFKPGSKQLLKYGANIVEGTLHAAALLRDNWASMVLSTPRWIMNNLPDTAMRSVVHGGNLWDDLATLFTSAQRTLADDLGIVPTQLTQSLARNGLDFSENVTSRLLYEGWKPKAGLFSYWKYEYRRLFKGDHIAAKREVLGNMLRGLPDGSLKSALSWLGDGLYVKTGLFLDSWSGAVADFNTAIEFTYRLRMFHKEYFNILNKVEGQFMERGLSGMTNASQEIAKQIWKASEGNPRRLSAYAEALAGKTVKGTPAQWALIVPPEIENITKGMNVVDRQLFTSSVRSSLEDFIATSTKAGKELKGDDFVSFFDDYVEKFRDEMQARMSQSHGFRDIDTTIRKDGKASQPLEIDDLHGSAPTPHEQDPRAVSIEKATSRLQKGKRARSEDIAKDFETAVSDYAAVERVAGDGIKATMKDGKMTIQVGENALKKSPKRLYNELHEATLSVFRQTDKEYVLRSGFKDLTEYEQTFRRFMDDPASILKEDERKFLTIANEMDSHPQLRELLERTRDKEKGAIKYDALMDFYRDIGEYSDAYGFTKPPEELFEAAAQEFRAQPGYHMAAAQEAKRMTAELARAEKNLPPELAEKVADFRERMIVYREELKQVYAFTYPGPLLKSVHGAERHKGWELFYKASADEFLKEAEIKRKVIELLQSNPAEAEKLIDGSLQDFGDWFLQQHGVQLEWDADMQKIMQMKITVNGRTRTFTNSHDLAHVQKRLFTTDINKKLADSPAIRLRKDARAKLHNQLRNALRDTFFDGGRHSSQAEAWAKVIDAHAQKWSEVTGRDITEYYERLGFQRIEDGRGLATRANTRLVKKGAVSRADGSFIFYGLGQSNFESMVRETGELFFDDLVSMADHSDEAAADLQALKTYIEKQVPGKPIRANRLDQEHSNVLSDLFTSYIAHGDGPDIKIKGGMDKFKDWLASTFEAVRDTSVADDMSDDIHRVMDRLFIEKQINDVPKMSKRKIKVIAKEMGLSFQSDDELLQIINDAVTPITADPASVTFSSLDEVPADIVTKTLAQNKESKIAKELQEGWDTWKTQRGLVGFPEEALADADTFKEYLRVRQGQEWSETSNYYNRLLWEVEQFEDSLLNYHAGDDFAEHFFPRVPESQISDGMKTFMRNQGDMVSNYESSLRALDEWKQYMVKIADEGHPAWVMPKEAKKELLDWSKRASQDKAEMMDTIINGSDEIEGAIDRVNRVMIDYQHSNNLDNIMRNFFPFWKFPSRSFPFWAETMITHPQLIANYEKIQKLSRSQRYQFGAVTSRGKPMPSLDGYIKVPGTDMWFNPLAPLSFRYILDIAKTKDDVMYAANTAEEDMEPKAFMVKELMQTGQIYGFSLAPWMSWLLKGAAQIPDEVLPRYPLAPQIPLIPRWMVADLVSKANKVTLPFDLDAGKMGEDAANMIYPEVPWHDYLVERHILEQTLAQIQGDETLSDKQKMELVNKAAEAIKQKKDNPLWQQAYKSVTTDEWVHNTSSFFTGFHPKEFSDMQAAMLQLRNERNQLKSALNNEFQADLFDIPADADKGWDMYLKALDAPDGWVYRLYSDIGWVRDEQGMLVRDPKERAKYLALKIKQDEDLQVYYDEMSELQNWYNETLRGLPVGANWEQVQVIYEKYAEKKAALQPLRSFEKFYGTNKPRELIERDIRNDWFREVNSTRPRWNMTKGETYDQYQARVAEWELNLPRTAPLLMRGFSKQTDLVKTLAALHDDQKLDPGFLAQLTSETTLDGIEEWEKGNDDVFDALNKAWKATYWDTYWNSVIGKTGYDADLAEQDFFRSNPEAPDAAGLYAWIQGYYGEDKFTFEQVQQWVDDKDPMSIDDRRLQDQDNPEDYQKRQDIWNMLSWLGPGGRNRGVFDQAFINAGGDPDQLTVWYDEAGSAYMTQPDKLDKLHQTISAAIKTLDLKEPARAELVRFVQAQEENDTFKGLVSEELGNRFFDWTDENGQTQSGLLSFYNGLGNSDRRKFREENADEYDAISAYYDMRETFGTDHITWNDYYGFDTTPSVKLPEGQEDLSLTPPNPRAPVIRRSGKGRGRNSSGQSGSPSSYSSYTSRDSIPDFYIPDRTGTYVSRGLYNLVGNKMAWEITSLFSSGRHISRAGVNFLQSVASRYPQYREEVMQILSKGT